jgi:hypothetical protein
MGYFDNLENGSLKNAKKKSLYMCSSIFRLIVIQINFMQFHYRLIVHQKSLNWNIINYMKI